MEKNNSGRHPYEIGFDDNAAGKTENDNPFYNGELTKLGAKKLNEDAVEWLNGFNSRKVRYASKEEIQAANSVDVSRFRRKSNRYYK